MKAPPPLQSHCGSLQGLSFHFLKHLPLNLKIQCNELKNQTREGSVSSSSSASFLCHYHLHCGFLSLWMGSLCFIFSLSFPWFLPAFTLWSGIPLSFLCLTKSAFQPTVIKLGVPCYWYQSEFFCEYKSPLETVW